MEHLLLNERSNSGPEETSLGLREIQLRSPQHAFNFRPAAITLLGEFEFTESAVAALPPPYVQRMLVSLMQLFVPILVLQPSAALNTVSASSLVTTNLPNDHV